MLDPFHAASCALHEHTAGSHVTVRGWLVTKHEGSYVLSFAGILRGRVVLLRVLAAFYRFVSGAAGCLRRALNAMTRGATSGTLAMRPGDDTDIRGHLAICPVGAGLGVTGHRDLAEFFNTLLGLSDFRRRNLRKANAANPVDNISASMMRAIARGNPTHPCRSDE